MYPMSKSTNAQIKPTLNATPAKGEKHGICNRGVCDHTDARWFNNSTRKYYCQSCAMKIMSYPENAGLLTLEEADKSSGKTREELDAGFAKFNAQLAEDIIQGLWRSHNLRQRGAGGEATIKRIEQEELEPALAQLTALSERVRVLEKHGVEALMIARSWIMVWGDKLSPESVARFAEHEKSFLNSITKKIV